MFALSCCVMPVSHAGTRPAGRAPLLSVASYISRTESQYAPLFSIKSPTLRYSVIVTQSRLTQLPPLKSHKREQVVRSRCLVGGLTRRWGDAGPLGSRGPKLPATAHVVLRAARGRKAATRSFAPTPSGNRGSGGYSSPCWWKGPVLHVGLTKDSKAGQVGRASAETISRPNSCPSFQTGNGLFSKLIRSSRRTI